MKIKKIINQLILVIFILVSIFLTYLVIRGLYHNILYHGSSAFGGIGGLLLIMITFIGVPFVIIFLIFSIISKYTKIFYLVISCSIFLILIFGYLIFPIHRNNINNKILDINKLVKEKNDISLCVNIKKLYWFKEKTIPNQKAQHVNALVNCIETNALYNDNADKCYELDKYNMDKSKCVYSVIKKRAKDKNDINICQELDKYSPTYYGKELCIETF